MMSIMKISNLKAQVILKLNNNANNNNNKN